MKNILDNLPPGLSSQKHFANPSNYGHTVLNQINSGFYEAYIPFMKNKAVLDLGANVGLFSVFASKYAKKVYSVEPTESHQKVFSEIIEGLRIKNVNLIKAAIVREDSTIPFFVDSANSTMNSLFEYGPNSSSTYSVEGLSIKSILSKIDVPLGFIKMDIEGSEKFLLGCPKFFDGIFKSDAMFIEVHQTEGNSFDDLVSLWGDRLKHGFNNVERVGVDGIFAWKGE